MTNPDPHPTEELIACGEDVTVEVLVPREVPLGGPRAMTVRRTLPARHRSLVGAWCFLDHYGPDPVSETGGMNVPPHPHIGLQTVSWLFTGEIEHRDSTGVKAMVRPSEFNLMTGGRGISHSEVSTPETTVLHGVQLWVALPAEAKDVEPGFDHYVPDAVRGEGWEARVFVGSLLGDTSPVRTHSPLLGAELLLDDDTTMTLDLDPSYEHGILLDAGSLTVGEEDVEPGELLYLGTGHHRVTLRAGIAARLVVIGGPPFGEEILMWWNFVGRTHEEVVAAREEWQAQLHRDGELVTDSTLVQPGRFGVVPGQHLPPIPAPPMPQVRLRPRR
ncbi:pirin family protein [Nocardioides sp. Y6]|uniref:Pirin family protein n=1 Tax=Nocardioides malaquae TaxID=2773426 RepID=A0ABR9RVK3_9ACTN|nr:pirin family protein [Nocardioides malaquae]MBE7325599.1 pirin family protein [Nocardioides malaquae]